MTDEQRAEKFLKQQTHMVLAVVLPDGTPWAVPVKLQRQEGLIIFEWDSHMSVVHSQALAANPHASVTLYQPHSERWSEFGFCASGKAAVVEQHGEGFARYLFTADHVWINDEAHKKRELNLKESEEN